VANHLPHCGSTSAAHCERNRLVDVRKERKVGIYRKTGKNKEWSKEKRTRLRIDRLTDRLAMHLNIGNYDPLSKLVRSRSGSNPAVNLNGMQTRCSWARSARRSPTRLAIAGCTQAGASHLITHSQIKILRSILWTRSHHQYTVHTHTHAHTHIHRGDQD